MTATMIRPTGADVTRMAANGWLPWSGGDCPVAPDTPVQIRLGAEQRFDEDQPVRRADTWRWDHSERGRRANITHYRVMPA
jgi:hypothetical protein